MNKIKIILNPISGMGNGAKQLPFIRGIFERSGINYDISITEKVWDAAVFAKEAALGGYSGVVAAGGDGTCNEVINGLMEVRADGEKLPFFGILPIGRGNDFAYGAGVPSDVSKASELIISAKVSPFDVGLIEGGDYPDGRFFVNGIGIGFDTMVGLEAAKLKFLHGSITYAWGAIVTLFKYPRAPSLRVHFNGETMDVDSSQVSILNGSRMGGTFFMAPNGKVDDGLLDLCMPVKHLSRINMIKLMIQYTKGTQESNPVIKMAKSTKYNVKAVTGNLVCHADGETICIDGKELKVECFPNAIRIYSKGGLAD
ncbi:MAG: diacylglycerol kinase family lipid kinase [Spirochaetia bacterium]|jgi:diacylglycerol kinase (ATP)|nr:diacylglycerol kinase family lipid kinase [Spirochaetia bacterium]